MPVRFFIRAGAERWMDRRSRATPKLTMSRTTCALPFALVLPIDAVMPPGDTAFSTSLSPSAIHPSRTRQSTFRCWLNARWSVREETSAQRAGRAHNRRTSRKIRNGNIICGHRSRTHRAARLLTPVLLVLTQPHHCYGATSMNERVAISPVA